MSPGGRDGVKSLCRVPLALCRTPITFQSPSPLPASFSSILLCAHFCTEAQNRTFCAEGATGIYVKMSTLLNTVHSVIHHGSVYTHVCTKLFSDRPKGTMRWRSNQDVKLSGVPRDSGDTAVPRLLCQRDERLPCLPRRAGGQLGQFHRWAIKASYHLQGSAELWFIGCVISAQRPEGVRTRDHSTYVGIELLPRHFISWIIVTIDPSDSISCCENSNGKQCSQWLVQNSVYFWSRNLHR